MADNRTNLHVVISIVKLQKINPVLFENFKHTRLGLDFLTVADRVQETSST